MALQPVPRPRGSVLLSKTGLQQEGVLLPDVERASIAGPVRIDPWIRPYSWGQQQLVL
jgi:hypothetical protein